MIRVKYFSSPEEIQEAAHIGLDHRLYHPAGLMQRWFRSCDIYIKAVFIGMNEDAPAGSFIILNELDTSYCSSPFNCGTFVLYNHRHLGCGKAMVAFAKELDYYILPWKGNMEATQFYNKVLN